MSGQTDIYTGASGSGVAPEIQMLRLASGHVPAQAIHVFASLGIADILHEGPKSADEIAGRVGAHGPTLYRVLRFLSTLNVVVEQENGQFAMTAMGGSLRRRGTSLVRDNALLVGSRFYWEWLGGLLDRVVTGQETPARDSLFEHLETHPEDGAIFDNAMDSLSRVTIPAVLAAYDFSGLRRIVDIGGGRGSLLTGILRQYPEVRGVLYDFAAVIKSAEIDDAVKTRVELIPGNFFESVPAGGDVYILRQILHQWDDAKAVEVLHQCRKVMPENGRLLIIEMTAPADKNTGNNWAALDLLMMILLGGRERTPDEFETLLRPAGFSAGRIFSTTSSFSIIEATPV